MRHFYQYFLHLLNKLYYNVIPVSFIQSLEKHKKNKLIYVYFFTNQQNDSVSLAYSSVSTLAMNQGIKLSGLRSKSVKIVLYT